MDYTFYLSQRTRHGASGHGYGWASVMVFGRARIAEKPDAIAEALRRFTDGLFPGRWETLRPMTQQELKSTSVLYLDIEEARAKARNAPPGDGDEAAYPGWAGLLPMETRLGPARPAPDLPTGIALPDSLESLMPSRLLR